MAFKVFKLLEKLQIEHTRGCFPCQIILLPSTICCETAYNSFL